MDHEALKEFGKYCITKKIGEGGMAVVYQVTDKETNCTAALKVISAAKQEQEKTRKRFLREIEILKNLSHENIVPVLDYGEIDGQLFLVMPLYEGNTLSQVIKEHEGQIPWQEAISTILPIAKALDSAHQKQVLHRDVKPSNILFDQDNQPVLSDFGISKLLEDTRDETLTSTGMAVGTPAYMAPEQFHEKNLDGRVDQYALGVILYEMITGKKPYEAQTPSEYVWKQAREALKRPSEIVTDLPQKVENVLLKALEKVRDNRYESMAGYIQALEDLLSGEDEGKDANEEKGDGADAKRRNNLAVIILGSILGVVLLGIVFGKPLVAGLIKPTPTLTNTPIPTATMTSTASLTPIPTQTPTPQPTLGVGSTKVSEIDGMSMVYVPAGEFPFGVDFEYEYAGEYEVIYLDAFWIDQTEVTNGMYKQCEEAGVCAKPSYDYPQRYPHMSVANYYDDPKYDDYPVVFVNINEAAMYCEWAGRRLPSDVEWEKAATGPEGGAFPWGFDEVTGSRVNFCDTNCPNDGGEQEVDDGYVVTAPVGSFPDGASPYGALDMSGNVWEIVSDNYIRGGAYNTTIGTITTFFRYPKPPDERGDHIGFRCVMDPE